MPRFEISPTPNPDSLKFTAIGTTFLPPGGLESFNSAATAAHHPLGCALFTVSGVANVLILPAFLTVTKIPQAHWDDVLPSIQNVLTAHLAHP